MESDIIDDSNSEEEVNDFDDDVFIPDVADPNVLSKKEIKRRKNAERKAELKAAFGPATNETSNSTQNAKRLGRRPEVTQHYLAVKNNSFSIAIDCTWESIHSDEDLRHLMNQLVYSYSSNRKHTHPADLRITGVGPRLHALLERASAFNWTGIPITKETYSEISILTSPSSSAEDDKSPPRKKTLVYLSPDADYVLTSVDPSCCYIVGGIIDRSVKKFLSSTKAREQGIPCARLPIKEHFKLGKTALTVNQVVEILLNFGKMGDWYSAMEPVLPKRKIGT